MKNGCNTSVALLIQLDTCKYECHSATFRTTSTGSDVFHTLDVALCLKFTNQWVWLESQFSTHWLKWPLSEVFQALETRDTVGSKDVWSESDFVTGGCVASAYLRTC